MRRLFYKTWVRACMVVLCIASFNVSALSLAVMLVGEGIAYSGDIEEMQTDAFHAVCEKYSVLAMARREDGFGMEELRDTNFRYGVIQADSIQGIDLNDRKNYVVCNFDRDVTADMLHEFSCEVGEEMYSHTADFLFDDAYIYNDEEYVEESRRIDGYYFASDLGVFYCEAEGRLYPVTFDAWPYDGLDIREHPSEYIDVNEEGERVWKRPKEETALGGRSMLFADIKICLSSELMNGGEELENGDYVNIMFQEGNVVALVVKPATPYLVLSYVNEPLEAEDGFWEGNALSQAMMFEKQDFFVQAKAFLQFLYSVRYGAVLVFLLSLALFLFSFIGAMTGAGHRNASEAVQGIVDRVPLELFTALIVGAWVILFGLLTILPGMRLWDMILFGSLLILAIEMLCALFCMSLAVRVKCKALWKNTLTVAAWSFFSRKLRGFAEKIGQAVPMLGKALIVMAALALLELLGLTATFYSPEEQVVLWLVEKLALYAILVKCLLQMARLKRAGERLAAGEMESRVDTEDMFFDFKSHGENLNNIREGIQREVDERMKSERFKTELITNVSHDIKTPLTSIINYVDLLEKEEIEGQAAQEYLKVLSRQSGRLKKLIEDLIEASKASAGTLSVACERCDAQVMLTQTIGEFEEKLKANEIELIVKSANEPLVVSADSRHLWRIFENLMNNICKYAQPSTRAYVNIEREGDACRIIFRNISKYALNIDGEELLERFVRGDSSRNMEGSGLGLSIAKSLTELMEGEFLLAVDGDLFKVIVTFPIL